MIGIFPFPQSATVYEQQQATSSVMLNGSYDAGRHVGINEQPQEQHIQVPHQHYYQVSLKSLASLDIFVAGCLFILIKECSLCY